MLFEDVSASSESVQVGQLNQSNGYLLYGVGEEVIVRQAKVAPSLFEAPPPTDHQSWASLGQQLETHEVDIVPGDLEAMLNQFPGRQSRLVGATLRDYRPTESGFRFVLALAPGYQILGEDVLGVAELAPDEYLVEYDGVFRLTKVTPPQLSLEALLPAAPESGELTQLLKVLVHNDGLADAAELVLVGEVFNHTGVSRQVIRQSVAVPAGQAVPLTLAWSPLGDDSEIHLRLEDGEENLLAETSQAVAGRRVEVDELRIAALSGSQTGPITAVLLLGLLGVVVMIGLSSLNRISAGRRGDV